MSAYNIYQKSCPACGAMVSRDAKHCDCSYSFESASQDIQLPEEQALQEEELFAAYLTARVGQAVATVESARVELATDPTNSRKAARLLQTVQEALTLRDEREAQAAKTEQARITAQAARTVLTPALDVPVQSAQPTEAFRIQQAVKAEKVAEPFTNTEIKKCPHCKTVLPVSSALCFCGYIFSRQDFMLPRAADISTRGTIYQLK
ncbi:MAG: hypothetical protein ACYC9L_05255 [Sulfuricaulis sp.]